jgi:ribosomal-protein-alanine N-acetyltransferase
VTPEDLAALHSRSGLPERAWSPAEYRALLSSPGAILVAKKNGFAIGRSVAGEAELFMIIVAPEARGSGMGRRLLRDFEVSAARGGASTILLEVAADNTAARTLYLSAEYQESGIRKAYYSRKDAPPVDAVTMRREITNR